MYSIWNCFKKILGILKTYKAMNRKHHKIKNNKKENVEHYIQLVMKNTGLTKDNVESRFRDARKRTGCMAKEFWLYRMYEMNEAEQEKVLLFSFQKKLRERYDIDKAFVNKILCDKEQTNDCFSKYIKRPWCVNTKVSFVEFSKLFANTSRLIYKPLRGNRGKGVESFYLSKEDLRTVFDKLATYPEGVVEEYIIQHNEMLKLCPSSVNTLRIVTISSRSETVTSDGKYSDIAYASLRIGSGESIVDNFHSGGMVANVDLATGLLVTDAADMNQNVFTIHPTTGLKIKGFKIPFFKEALEMVLEAINANNVEGYLGWDIAITETGPVLVEINSLPGVVLLQTPYAYNHKGMKYVMEKYIH